MTDVEIRVGEEANDHVEAEPVEGEVIETAADAAVEIAQIEADRDVTLAVIEGENVAAANEAFADALNTEMETELAQCRTRISELETAVASATARAETAETALSILQAPPSSSETNPEHEPESVDPTPDKPGEAEPEVPSEPPRKAKRHRWI